MDAKTTPHGVTIARDSTSEINGALDTGKYDDITLKQVSLEIQSGIIFSFLQKTLGNSFDLSILDMVEQRDLLAECHDLLGVNARKKFLVTQRGLCLLVAFLLEGIQRIRREAMAPYTNPPD